MEVRGLRVLSATALAAGLLALGAGGAFAHGSVNGWEARQRHRIHAGVEEGSLSRGEARRLVREQQRIEGLERRLRRSGDGLGPRERRVLDRRLDHASRHIRRARQNDRARE